MGLGQSPDRSALRDAVHVAVAPVVAGERLEPGERVRLGPLGHAFAAIAENMVGVVDPFLTHPVRSGESFWMMMVPNTITGLRHDWDHPAFPAKANLVSPWQSEHWLTAFGEEHGWDYEDTLRTIAAHVENGDAGVNMRVPEEVYDHYEVVTGKSVPIERRILYFVNEGCAGC